MSNSVSIIVGYLRRNYVERFDSGSRVMAGEWRQADTILADKGILLCVCVRGGGGGL